MAERQVGPLVSCSVTERLLIWIFEFLIAHLSAEISFLRTATDYNDDHSSIHSFLNQFLV